MGSRSQSKTVLSEEKRDPLWEDIKAGFESIKEGKITEWKFSK
jgi:hypothetical protein